MNLRTGLKTGIAALTIATAPLTASAQKTAATLAHDSVRIERTLTEEAVSLCDKASHYFSKKTISDTTPDIEIFSKDAKMFPKIRLQYSNHSILDQKIKEPQLCFEVNTLPSEHSYFNPKLTIGTESYSAVLPIGFTTGNSAPTVAEVGADFVGVRGLYNKKVLFNSDIEILNNNKVDKISPASHELFQDIHLGIRHKNEFIDASFRGELGKISYVGGGFITTGKGLDKEAVQTTNIPIINTPPKRYAAAKANIEVKPLRNENITFNAEGVISTNKSPEFNVGIGYTF